MDLDGSTECQASDSASQVSLGPESAGGVVIKRAVVLLSGGIDSTTAAAMVKAKGYQLHALTFRYGQRHAREVESAKRIAAAIGAAQHLILDLDLRQIGGSALTADIPVPKAGIPALTTAAALALAIPPGNGNGQAH